MTNFTKRIVAENAFLSFYFNKIPNLSPEAYYISVVDANRKTIGINMIRQSTNWIMSNPDNCPSWITSLEKEFSRLINEHIANTE